jgi:hypothetical protein
MQVYAARDPKALGIPRIEPKLLCSFSSFIQDYASHVPSALDIPSIAPDIATHCLVFFISPSFQKYFLTLF